MRGRRLLIITTRYPHAEDSISASFIRSRVEVLRKHFEKVVVIATRPYIPLFLTRAMHPNRKRDALSKDHSYENVDVHYLKNTVL
ncbi:MAG: glycosyltransferase family 4 protein, partial [Thermoplasmata archaeon]|nr:glycosyltransferase family 4 protein [Thermoplasmata archaeon]